MSRLALEPYYGKRVRVYRNLRAGKASGLKVYSVMYEGRVVAHVSEMMLVEAEFVVHKAGQKRVRAEKRKNVHAFIVGYPMRTAMGITPSGDLPVKVTYNPYENDHFIGTQAGELTYPIESAMACVINQRGVSAAYTKQVGRS